MKVKKCVIPVAGFGTRFLPVTKALPKEMLPIIDKPVVQYIAEEAVASGIEDIILVTGQNKRAVEDHFDFNGELEAWLKTTKKYEALRQIRDIAQIANFIYVRQKGPYGNGTPILNVRELIGDNPFAVLWGDDVLVAKKPRLRQLIEVYEKYGDPVLCAIKVAKSETKKYGMIEGVEVEPGIVQVKRLKEKPSAHQTKSRLASIGGYILTPDIFDELARTPLRNHELYLPDAIDRLLRKRPVYACLVSGDRYDAGSKLGWLQANISLGLRDKNLKKPLKKFLKNLMES